ncbi:unnamed protein product [Cylicocyclus nassatus]|uniref:Uncharacterized protein n=1 Tax=Cylicocyclus nassatus TaxID=53992 RepID=A0AA36DQE0_CYLNA|nr:unnamed protein product [Cylicocyclus nassatus]
MDEKKVRITAMTSPEMCIVSQWYVQNYEVYHGISTSSSKDGLSFAQRKQKLLEDICEDLVRNGFSKRTPEQINQRIKDTLKTAKKISALERNEETKTGGGPPTAIAAAPHVRIVIEGCDNRPRLSGLKKPLEINANATNVPSIQSASNTQNVSNTQNISNIENVPTTENLSNTNTMDVDVIYEECVTPIAEEVDVFPSATDDTPAVTPLSSGLAGKPLNSPPRKRRRSTQALTDEKEQVLQLEAERIQKQIQNEILRSEVLQQSMENKRQKNVLLCLQCEEVKAKIDYTRLQIDLARNDE